MRLRHLRRTLLYNLTVVSSGGDGDTTVQPDRPEIASNSNSPLTKDEDTTEDEEYREVKGPDGKVYRLRKDEWIIFKNGKPIILPVGEAYTKKTYTLTKDGVEIEVDEEFGAMMEEEIKSLHQKIAEAEDEETKAKYQAQLDALYEEFGNLGTQTSSIRTIE